MWTDINNDYKQIFESKLEKWQPIQNDIDMIVEDMKELINSTIDDCGDIEMAEEQKQELKKLQINTFEKKQELAKDYIKEIFYCTPINVLLNGDKVSYIYKQLIN
ncbi:hypothetical protein SH1V18_02760 [Vallitalea longa]|uniref:Uncharacterized protein n=1 Tax=Vallitalea longa TaxID=2936439 RepID=A0A9W6DD01_9FIRM|nr:hypothetical protein [Vallitalea longa]GKX27796.1 hypothetical protein SH1V18_02760 [Vallitalea longa]